MNPQTIGCNCYGIGKNLPIQCVKGDSLNDLEIQNSCFLLVIMHTGTACFKIGDTSFEAVAPCVVCFDETASPKLIKKKAVECDSIYFKPLFLNINMTFKRIHLPDYADHSLIHDFFLLKPFTDKNKYVFPLFDQYVNNFDRLFTLLDTELTIQRDWYWSCRSRSYFIEIVLFLESIYGLSELADPIFLVQNITNPHLQKAIIYVSNNFHRNISTKSMVATIKYNHSSLTQLFKNTYDMTPMEYIWHYRLTVSKKFLEFTNLPIKDIASRCGFKTIQHFSAKFISVFGCNPSTFRTAAIDNRRSTYQKLSK